MQIFLVGGAVRDQLLGLEVTERDWVVVGATPEQMIALNFLPVGKEFPVFLHPKTHEEYALARTERKISRGYKGFEFYTATTVTLEQDLQRRDLTINAIAKTDDGKLIDPYHGQQDLTDKILRHVSAAFVEDPVRILRIARFASKLPDFNVHPSTQTLMQTMVENGEVNALVAERVWQEFRRALAQVAPERFFTVLAACGALAVIFPEIALTDVGVQLLKTQAKQITDYRLRFAILMHAYDLTQVKQFCQRLRVNKEDSALAQLCARFFKAYDQLDLHHAPAILQLLRQTDALRRPSRFSEFLKVCYCCTTQKNLAKSTLLQSAQQTLINVDTQELQARQLTGPAFAQALEKLQIQAIEQLLNAH